MVATLVRLRWRLTLNALGRSVWILLAALLGAAWALGAVISVTAGAVALGLRAPAPLAADLIGALGALTALGWILIPLLLTGVDSTLDPRALAPWIAPSRSLSAGLAAAGAAGVPGIATGICLVLPALVWAVGGHWDAAGLALLLAPVALATCVLVSRVVVIGTGASTTRRGRDVIGVIGGVAVIGAAFLPSLVNLVATRSARLDGSALATLTGIGRVLSLTPLGWALAAPGHLAQGRVGAALALTAGALALPIVLAPLWDRTVRRVMSGGRAAGRPRSAG